MKLHALLISVIGFHYVCTGMDQQHDTEELTLPEILDHCSRNLDPYPIQKPLLKLPAESFIALQNKRSLEIEKSKKLQATPEQPTLLKEHAETLPSFESQEITLHKSKIHAPIPPKKQHKKKQDSLPKKVVQKNQQPQTKLPTPVQLLNTLRINCGFQHIKDIGPWLAQKCELCSQFPQYNNTEEGPHWDKYSHTLFLRIKQNATCIYSPCHGMYTAIPCDFSEVITWKPHMLHPKLACTQNCPNIYNNDHQELQMKLLRKLLGISEKESLPHALFKICMGFREYPAHNILEWIYWHEDYHLLFIKITDNSSCIYSPCSQTLIGLPYTFSKIITMNPKDLDTRMIICTKDCPNHRYKGLPLLFRDEQPS